MPKWLDTAVFYEIYPQSFLDTNADGIGDFQGIIRKLDYIRELGFNALWIRKSGYFSHFFLFLQQIFPVRLVRSLLHFYADVPKRNYYIKFKALLKKQGFCFVLFVYIYSYIISTFPIPFSEWQTDRCFHISARRFRL